VVPKASCPARHFPPPSSSSRRRGLTPGSFSCKLTRDRSLGDYSYLPFFRAVHPQRRTDPKSRNSRLGVDPPLKYIVGTQHDSSLRCPIPLCWVLPGNLTKADFLEDCPPSYSIRFDDPLWVLRRFFMHMSAPVPLQTLFFFCAPIPPVVAGLAVEHCLSP